jgi:hypothetical protein
MLLHHNAMMLAYLLIDKEAGLEKTECCQMGWKGSANHLVRQVLTQILHERWSLRIQRRGLNCATIKTSPEGRTGIVFIAFMHYPRSEMIDEMHIFVETQVLSSLLLYCSASNNQRSETFPFDCFI